MGADVSLALGFVDNAPAQTHKAAVDWNDGCTSPYPLVSESGGVGEVTFRHHFCNPGYYFLTVKVTDSGGRSTETRRDVVRFEGTGRFNGRAGYRFQDEAQGSDRLHVRITHADAAGKEVVDYDNGASAGGGAAAKAAAPAAAPERTLVSEGRLTLSS